MKQSASQGAPRFTLIFASLLVLCRCLFKFPLQKLPAVTLEAQVSSTSTIPNYESVWVTPVAINTTVLTLTPLLYSQQTWISAIEKGEVKPLIKCGDNVKCNLTDISMTENMLNYDITGNVTFSNGYEFILANEFNYTPAAQINGGFGLGSYNGANSSSFPYTFSGIDPLFSLYVSRNFIQTSYLVFGGYESQYILHNARFQRINALAKSNWTFSLSRVDSQSLNSVAIFDLNTPYIGIPQFQYDVFLNNFTSQYRINCNISTVVPTCDCANFETLPALTIVLDDVSFDLPPSTYTETNSKTCSLLFTKTSADNTTTFNVTDKYANVWVLGEPFLTYNYMVFYYQAGYVDIAPSREISTNLAAWIIMILVCSLGFIGIVLYRCYQLGPKGKLREQAKNDEENLLSEELVQKKSQNDSLN